MNKHVNKNKRKRPVPQNIAVTEPADHMPKEVAESLLLTPGTKLTARMRKNCNAARIETVFVSTLQPKTLPEYLARHLKSASAAQLAKWAIRTFHRRGGINKRLIKASQKLRDLREGGPPRSLTGLALTLVIERLNAQATSADVFMAALDTEAKSRLCPQ